MSLSIADREGEALYIAILWLWVLNGAVECVVDRGGFHRWVAAHVAPS